MLIILGNQLFPLKFLPPASEVRVFMAEDMGLCTYVKHHQQKIVLFLAAMRSYADELRDAGYEVIYSMLDTRDEKSYEEKLYAAMSSTEDRQLTCFEIEDKPFERRIRQFVEERNITLEELASPMFTCSRAEFQSYVGSKQNLLMADYYKQQRLRLDVLVDDNQKPSGGKWSYDELNRKKLPRDVSIPTISTVEHSQHVNDVIALVQDAFSDHTGDAQEFHWPTTRKQAGKWLDDFLVNRLGQFGPYEDAMTKKSATVFHSLLTPCLNMGLLTPDEVIEKVLEYRNDLPLQSIEGFVRQVIGWREFIRGIYRNFSEQQEEANFWKHERELSDSWYSGATGIIPLDDTIHTALRLGWTHHIPRLMIVGNLMTLCEIRPQTAHQWFMEMYVDSSEWVMGPNVYGMGLFSDGGLFATKPYICGSNYLLKMSDYGKGPWCDIVDGLYWRFIDKHRDYFAGNPRLSVMPRGLDRLKPERKEVIFNAAENFLAEHTMGSS